MMDKTTLTLLSATDLATAAFPVPEAILAPILSRGSQCLLYGLPGVGKSLVALGIAHAAATGGSFLGWHAPRPHRVLYLDGYTAPSEMQRRLAETHKAGSTPALREAPILNPDTEAAGDVGSVAPQHVGEVARVEVPADITELQRDNPRLAARWRQTTRRAFHRARDAGLVVQGFVVDDCAKRGYYLLSRPT